MTTKNTLSTDTLRVDLYARISLVLDDTVDGIARQSSDLTREAQRHDEWLVEREPFADESITASGEKVRPDFQKVLDRMTANLTDAVLVNDLDRFTRCPKELEAMIELAEKRGKRFFTLKQGEIDLSTGAGRAMARVVVTMARFEIDQMADRQRSKIRHAVDAGRAHGTPAYGYRVGASSRERVKDEAVEHVVEAIFVKLLAREPLHAVARWLNEEHPRAARERRHNRRAWAKGDTFGGEWTAHALRRMATNPTYAGVVVHRTKKATGDGPRMIEQSRRVDKSLAYISQREHEQLVDWLSTRSTGTRSREASRRHLLSGIARCGVCSTPMAGNDRASGAMYRCPRGCMGIAMAQTDDKAITFLIRRIADEWQTIAAPKRSKRSALDVEIDELRDVIAGKRDRLDMATTAKAEAELLASIERLEAKLAKLEASKPARVAMPASVAEIAAEPSLEAMRKRFESYEDVAHRAAIVRALLDVEIRPAVSRGSREIDGRIVITKRAQS